MIWKHKPDLKTLNSLSINTLVGHLAIEFTEVGDDFLIAKMPVDHRTMQPMGLLHGGASVALAETIGSVASTLLLEDFTKQAPVGIEINANHLNSAREGHVHGKVTPIKLGKRLHVWQIDITDDKARPICSSRLTTMIIERG